MYRHPRLCRATLLLLGLIGCGLIGCAVPQRSVEALKDESGVPLPDLDPTRAFLKLSQIQPAVVKPSKADSFKPLSDRAIRQIASAESLVREQRYTEAALELERALRYDPNHPQIHRTLSMLHWQAGNLARAKSHASRAVDLNPDDAPSHYILGRCSALDGDMAGALSAYRTALQCPNFDHDPETATLCHYHLAGALAKEGYLEAALAQYSAFGDKANALPGPAEQSELVTVLQASGGQAGEARSRLLERLGRYAKAAAALAPLVAESPDHVELGGRYARLLMRAGRYKDALAAARALPADDRIIELLFEIHQSAGKPGRIVDDLRSRLAGEPDQHRLVLALADMLLRLDRASEARDELQRFLAGHDHVDSVRHKLVDVLIMQSAWADAVAVSAEGVQYRPERAAEFEAKIRTLAENENALDELLKTRQQEDHGFADTYLRGVLAQAAGRFLDATDLFRASLSTNPTFVPARVALGRVYLRLYRYDEALRIAARDDPEVPQDSRLEKVLGEVNERLDDQNQAERHFKAAVQLDRADTDAMFSLAELYRRSGRILQTQRQLRVLLDEDPSHEAARETLALTYLSEGKVDVAFQLLEELARLAVRPTTIARCSAMLGQFPNRDPESYRRTLIDALEQNRPDARTWIAVAESYGEFSDARRARDAYLAALAVEPDSERAARGVVRTEEQLLNYEAAARRLAELLPRRPNRHSWRQQLLGIYVILQDYESALTLARQEAARNDIDEGVRTRYRLRVADTLRFAGKGDEAIALLKGWADADPENLDWANRLAGAYLLEGEPSEAVAILEDLLERVPGDSDLLRALLQALIDAGLFDRASQHVLDILRDDPDSDDAIALLASVLGSSGQFDDSLEVIRSRLLRTFRREFFQERLADHLRQADRHSECIAWIETLIDEVMTLMKSVGVHDVHRPTEVLTDEQIIRLPEEPFSSDRLHHRLAELRLLLAGILIEGEEYREAGQLLTTWLDQTRDPRYRFEYLLRLVECFRRQGRELEASNTVERALVLRPDNVTFSNDLSYWWIDRGVRLEEAEKMIRYALWRSPRQGAYLDTFGWLHYKKGAFAEAKKWLERANRAETAGDPVLADHLGDVCWRLGSKEEAIMHWTAALEALQGLSEVRLVASDVQRVQNGGQAKIDAARSGRVPEVAPLGISPSSDENSGDGGNAAAVHDK